jgi:hypothetical protein
MAAPGNASRDRRMSGDDELCARVGGARHDREEGERTRDRERRLGLVEDVDPIAAEAVGGQGEERLAVRLAEQRAAAVDLGDVLGVEAAGEVRTGAEGAAVRAERHRCSLRRARASRDRRIARKRSRAATHMKTSADAGARADKESGQDGSETVLAPLEHLDCLSVEQQRLAALSVPRRAGQLAAAGPAPESERARQPPGPPAKQTAR